ncbi:MAG: hypothetical protein ACR652_01270 [Methylocystis sp.]|uniref:hypothetical protein n=1 Tax=Methylocystis sp. TaxID=1911079 RepID=UPI003DA513F8
MSTAPAHRKTRASPLRRLPVRITRPSTPWVPDWSAIEAGAGMPLDSDRRARFTNIVARYRAAAPAARDAPLVKEAVRRLADIEEAFLALRNAILKAAPGGMAETYARSVLAEFVRSTGSRDIGLDNMWRAAGDMAWAARAAADAIGDKDQPSTGERTPWETMVRELSALAGDIGISTTMDSKHPSRHPFPRFVLAVHDSLGDVDGWWPSEDSLIAEIRKALRKK